MAVMTVRREVVEDRRRNRDSSRAAHPASCSLGLVRLTSASANGDEDDVTAVPAADKDEVPTVLAIDDGDVSTDGDVIGADDGNGAIAVAGGAG